MKSKYKKIYQNNNIEFEEFEKWKPFEIEFEIDGRSYRLYFYGQGKITGIFLARTDKKD